ncbi:hypothetical protein [Streptomyces cinereoruber]|uniref:hypothetical protein n=1 Tax=Streptomyces cinereoruber TaxID=67260 RepID=UPI00362F3992
MNNRNLMIQVIREVVRGLPIEEVKKVADSLPAQPLEGTFEFCNRFALGMWFGIQISSNDISPAHELYEFIGESTLADLKRKEAEASGENKDGGTQE